MELAWKDGQPYSQRYGDVYFSNSSGLQETHHVFLQGNRLAERFAALLPGEYFCIGETGFGTGLNFLATMRMFEKIAPADASLDYFSIEKFPLSDEDLHAALALWPDLRADQLLSRWRRRVPGWNRWGLSAGRVRLTVAIEDVADALPQLPNGSVNAWFLDGFSPAKNPEMWAEPVLKNLARASCPEATLATYTSAGWVRRGLQNAGFNVEKAPGFGRKREMLRGALSPCIPSLKIEQGTYLIRTVLVVGGGLAGCAAAYALAQRGLKVTLMEQESHLASAASGNLRGILHARFGASGNALHRFVLAAYGHVLALLDELMPVDNVGRAECGLLQLAFSDAERKRITRMGEQKWPEHLLQIVDKTYATQLAGMEMPYGGLWFPSGGWIAPPRFCMQLANDIRISLHPGHHVGAMEKCKAGWHVSGRDTQGKEWGKEYDAVVVCCANSAKKLSQFSDFPLTPVRGQITELPETPASQSLHSVVCGDGYCAPAVHGVHVIGATHSFEDESTELRTADHAENLSNLEAFAPSLRHALGRLSVESLGGRASVRCSAPGAMPLVGEVSSGLYCSLAHGTRGILTAGLAGEVLASLICGQLPPLPATLLAALAPKSRLHL